MGFLKTESFSKKRMVEGEKQFTLYLEAIYVTNVTFQKFYMPYRTVKQTNFYFSGKCHLYGFKTKAFVHLLELLIVTASHFLKLQPMWKYLESIKIGIVNGFERMRTRFFYLI